MRSFIFFILNNFSRSSLVLNQENRYGVTKRNVCDLHKDCLQHWTTGAWRQDWSSRNAQALLSVFISITFDLIVDLICCLIVYVSILYLFLFCFSMYVLLYSFFCFKNVLTIQTFFLFSFLTIFFSLDQLLIKTITTQI